MASGAYNRDKGARFEREVRTALQEIYGPKVRKYRQASSHDTDIPDVGTDDETMIWDVECKCTGRLSVTAYMRQAEKRCREGKVPIVWSRLLRLGPGREEYVIMRPQAFLAMAMVVDQAGVDLAVRDLALKPLDISE